MNKNNFRVVLLVLIETCLLFVCIQLLFKIYQFKGSVKGTSTTRIDKDTINFSSNSDSLKYYYEPKLNSQIKWKPDWLGYEVINHINSDSLNENNDYPLSKSSDTYRIVTLGDSFTYGLYVGTSENYSTVLENLLNNNLHCKTFNKYEVINLGVYGYDVAYSVERLIKRGLKYNPDLVIFFINEWNLNKINEIYLSRISQNDDVGKLNLKTGNYDNLSKILTSINNEYSSEILQNYNYRWLLRMSQSYNGNLLLLSFTDIYKLSRPINQFVNLNNKNTFHRLDDISNNKSLIFLDKHPNIKGHKKIAEDLFDYLKKTYFNDCKFVNK